MRTDEELRTQEVAKTPPPHPRKKVLVIDDSRTIRELVRHTLAMGGEYDVVTAEDGADGLKQYYHERPDCVVVDVMMPNLNGYQFVRCVRGDADSSHTPLVILTALASDDSRLTGILSGADAYVTKPFDTGDLRSIVRRVLAMTPEDRAQRLLALAEVDGDLPDGAAANAAREEPGMNGVAGAGGPTEAGGDSA